MPQSIHRAIALAFAATAAVVTSAAGQCPPPFEGPFPFLVGSREAMAVADFDRDGITDVVVHSTGPYRIEIFRGRGDGTFESRTSISYLVIPKSITVADLNRDGFLDIALTSGNGGAIFRGGPDWTFTSGGSLSAGSFTSPEGIAAGDFNGDGWPDLVMANNQASSIGVFLNNGAGTMLPVRRYNLGDQYPTGVATVDINRDGYDDIVVANIYAKVFVFYGDATGVPTGPAVISCGGAATRHVVIADATGDGLPDVVTANSGSQNIGLLRGTPSGGLAPVVTFAVPGAALGVCVADVDGDAVADLCAFTSRSQNQNRLAMLRGLGNGAFAAATTTDTGDYASSQVTRGIIHFGHIDTDGRIDLFTVGNSSAPLRVHRNQSASPVFSLQPEDVQACVGVAASLVCEVIGQPPFVYAWQVRDDTVPGGWRGLEDGPLSVGGEVLGAVSGAGSAALSLTASVPLDQLEFRASVLGDCGSANSRIASLSVILCSCPADWDGSGGIDGDDIGAFFTDWQQGNADIDQSGGTDGDDISYFFVRWQAGC